jgi:hypothetical protein
MLHDPAQKTLKEDSHEQKALQKALSRFGVLLSLTQVGDVATLPKAQAIRVLLDMYDAGHRPITEDLVRQVHHAFIEEFVCLAGESNGFKSLL